MADADQPPCQHLEIGARDNDGFAPCLACGVVRRWPDQPVAGVDVAAVRERLKIMTNKGSTHWDGCWRDHHRSHDGCAVILLLDALDALTREKAERAHEIEDFWRDKLVALASERDALKAEVSRLREQLQQAEQERDARPLPPNCGADLGRRPR